MSEPRSFTANTPASLGDRGLVRVGMVDLTVAAPAACVEVHEFMPRPSLGGLESAFGWERPTIPDGEHRRLLEESLAQYRPLWASLAKR